MKRILIVDDVISTGESLAAVEKLVEEAGGIITDMKGQKLDFTHPSSVLCGNRQAHEQWLCEIRDM